VRVLVHDYSGHPFQVQLSRELARRGHTILHLHCTSYATGKGAVERSADDADTFDVVGLAHRREFDRYRSPLRRVQGEIAYGRDASTIASRFQPDVVLSSNDPLFAKATAAVWCRRTRTPWVFWLQDLYSKGMGRYANDKLGRAGRAFATGFELLERRLLHEASEVVAITDDFRGVLDDWKVPSRKVTVIENWAPIGELPVVEHDNAWSRRHDLDGRFVFLYSGTLGLKHNPALVVSIAERFADDPDVRVVVSSQGMGADWLREQKSRRSLDNLVLLPYQPYADVPAMMGTADVLVTLLDAEAGAFSVPSKVLTYLCAGRPVLAAVPKVNLARRLLERSRAGVGVEPTDERGFVEAAAKLRDGVAEREERGAAGRAFAEAHFDIGHIADRFIEVLERASTKKAGVAQHV